MHGFSDNDDEMHSLPQEIGFSRKSLLVEKKEMRKKRIEKRTIFFFFFFVCL